MPKKELKKRYNVSLYPSTVKSMDNKAKEMGITRSDLIENHFKVTTTCMDKPAANIKCNDYAINAHHNNTDKRR